MPTIAKIIVDIAPHKNKEEDVDCSSEFTFNLVLPAIKTLPTGRRTSQKSTVKTVESLMKFT